MFEKKLAMSLGVSALGVLVSSTTSFADEKEAFVIASALNVRTEASINSSIITKVYKGEVVKITESSDGWYKIKTSSGVVGWSSANYLKINQSIPNIEDEEYENNKDNQTNENNKIGIVTARTLNLRSGAGTNHSVISRLKRNESVNIIESNNGWYKIKTSSGITGWSSSKYISLKNNDQSNSQDTSNNTQDTVNNNTDEIKENVNLINKDGRVTSSSLNVRSGIGTSNAIITKLKKDDTVKVIESSSGWYKIKTSSGITGWSSGNYIDLIENNNSQANQENEEIKEEIPKVESSLESDNEKVKKVIDLAMKQIGKPYLWGSEGPDSFDCSGLVYYVFKESIDMKLPRTSREQYKIGTEVLKSDLKAGDLLFSSTRSDRVITHVGIYIGDGKMIHSPNSGKDVEISDISSNYWEKSYVGAKRVL